VRIAAVIPALNEADAIAGTVADVSREVDEVIVVDGGSIDDTAARAHAAGARVQVAHGSTRAVALNMGAAIATSEILYFVHADTRPPPGFAADIHRAVALGAGAGCFRMCFDSQHWLLRLSGWCTRFDVDLIRFGDQTLFVRRELHRSIGGFDERLAVMEDQEIVRRLRRHARFEIVPRPVIASARRYRQRGVYRLQLVVYPLVVALYHVGLAQPRLMRIYWRLLGADGARPSRTPTAPTVTGGGVTVPIVSRHTACTPRVSSSDRPQ
jgi:rSAM/selenodomain-associated transferase 2